MSEITYQPKVIQPNIITFVSQNAASETIRAENEC